MIKTFKGDIIELVEKSHLITDRLYRVKCTFPNFSYNVKLIIGQDNKLIINTNETTKTV